MMFGKGLSIPGTTNLRSVERQLTGKIVRTVGKRNDMYLRRIARTGLPAFVMLCMLYGFLSCRKENLNGIHSMNDSTVNFSAVIGGTAWQTDSVSAFLVGYPRDRSRIMTITGFTSKRVISISLRDTSNSGNDSTLAVQSYPLEDWGNASAFAYGYNRIGYGPNTTWQQQGPGISGQASVTVSDGIGKRLSGTFSFRARLLVIDSTGWHVDSVDVTNGVFQHVPYSYLKHP